jgi:hypothetical protein
MELLDLYQLRMDKCAAEQFWAMAMITAMNGFVLLYTKRLLEVINIKMLVTGILGSTILFCGYIISRHIIYMHYDSLANELIKQIGEGMKSPVPDVEGYRKVLALWSGVSFYSLITIVTGLLSFLAVRNIRRNKREHGIFTHAG